GQSRALFFHDMVSLLPATRANPCPAPGRSQRRSSAPRQGEAREATCFGHVSLDAGAMLARFSMDGPSPFFPPMPADSRVRPSPDLLGLCTDRAAGRPEGTR